MIPKAIFAAREWPGVPGNDDRSPASDGGRRRGGRCADDPRCGPFW
jgi:hypothetical protein